MSRREGSLAPRPRATLACRCPTLRYAASSFPPSTNFVRRRQAELNPRAARLLRRLEDAARRPAPGPAVEAVRGRSGPSPPPDRHRPPPSSLDPPPPSTGGVFPAKVLGLRVCSLYLEWVSRTEADLGQLAPGGPA
ncbi:Cardiotrophin-1 [Camelus dromedarius]|uniref:Cardiotrophin-1 n=1 Tax=Camelus dromedarius TaxID=9838 RepID=A0A5N4CYE8_CAMDR|nr:Cardiotrophin-1 [Camelus dromedarius]